MTAAIFQQSIDKPVDLSNGMLERNFNWEVVFLESHYDNVAFFFHEFLRVLEHSISLTHLL